MARVRFTAVVALVLLPHAVAAQETSAPNANDHGMTVTLAAAAEFAPITPPGFEPGMEISVLAGDPGASGPYTLRLSFPDGYRFPAHWHPQIENLTVLTGTFLLAEGTEEDWDVLTRYQPGDYMHIPARSSHYGGAEGETVIQLHGTGPFDIILSSEQPPAGGD